MSILIIDNETRKTIAEAIKKARENPVPWDEAAKMFKQGPPKKGYDEKRQKMADELYAKHPAQSMDIGNVRVAFTFEYQPGGLFRHISFSINKKGKVLDFIPSEVLVVEFGFTGLPPTKPYSIWTEEYAPGMFAINVIELEEEGAKYGGH